MGTSDPLLRSLLTTDATSTRFHACERWNRCEHVTEGTSGVVYINPVTLSKVKWDLYYRQTTEILEHGDSVTNLVSGPSSTLFPP